MLPFKFWGEDEVEEPQTGGVEWGESYGLAFNMRVWARVDNRISKGITDDATAGAEGASKVDDPTFLQTFADRTC